MATLVAVNFICIAGPTPATWHVQKTILHSLRAFIQNVITDKCRRVVRTLRIITPDFITTNKLVYE
jgi:hypothetical protein